MSIPVLIIGPSGTGKSTSLRNLDPNECLLIQTIKKPLPFKHSHWKMWDAKAKSGSIFVTDKAKFIIACIQKAAENKKKIIIIDDFQYQMANEYMRRANEKGYQKFTDIGKDVWDIVQATINCEDDLRVYILSHSYQDDLGENIKMKTIGKMLDDKITVEGMFTIVLRSIFQDGAYSFRTQNNGFDTVKSPMGMFKDEVIDNDLAQIDDQICQYYSIKKDRIDPYLLAIGHASKIKDNDFQVIVINSIEKFKDKPNKLMEIIEKIKLKNKGNNNE